MELLKDITFVVVLIVCSILTVKCIYHIWFVVTNIKGKFARILGPFLLFMPNQFNDVGNKHRALLFRAVIGVIGCWFILLLSE